MKSNPEKDNTFVKLAKRILECSREKILSLLFPLRCPVCDEILAPEDVEKGIHLECERRLYPVEGAVCMHCGRPLGQINPRENNTQEQNNFMEPSSIYEYCAECHRKGYVGKKGSYITRGNSLYRYRGDIKKTMYRFKYSNKREYARFFAIQAVRKYDFSKIDVLVPVPMYVPKQKQRGYNQAGVFADELSCLTGVPVDSELVKRTKDTTPQKNLSYEERKNNLENAFQIGKSVVKYNCAMVIDDIYTTGCTAEAVARELKKRGIHQVYFLSICIGEYM